MAAPSSSAYPAAARFSGRPRAGAAALEARSSRASSTRRDCAKLADPRFAEPRPRRDFAREQ
eukprot:3567945-Pyramimonas_sp.AAC.1